MQRIIGVSVVLFMTLSIRAATGQDILQGRGVDSRVDYSELTRYGPWDDRNYALTQEDLALLAPGEAELPVAIPAFHRVYLRRTFPELRRAGALQYPRSVVAKYLVRHGGYLVDGKLYRRVRREGGRFVLTLSDGLDQTAFLERKALDGEVRVSSPEGNAESAIAANPVDPDFVIAGSNGLDGQDMHYSSDGGETWNEATLPLGNSCCDPSVGWSSDGIYAYAVTLGFGAGEPNFFYRSADKGQTWGDLANAPGAGGDPRREFGSVTDKCYLHVDLHPTSPHKDNIYVTWHENNVMQLGRSTDSGNNWTTQSFASVADQLGIGSDITTDKDGNVHYFWPADSRRIWLRKSTDGGVSYAPVVEVATTEASYDFPLPSVETNRAWIYVSVDTDRSDGPYGGSVYAAWTDTTAPDVGNPSNNHARIQVGTSRDGGASWTVATPHETADANLVDRWNQWLSVGPDGTVYVIFYDTRGDPARTAVDLYYSTSTDGAQTFSTPARLTSQPSPNVADGFEFGDYNGLDIVMSDLIAVYTDNRSEGGGGGDSVDIYAVGVAVEAADSLFEDGFEAGDTSAWPGS
ncbi:MAG: hypothetical protein V3T72_08005 [Thermoanaerobaculia bacterium]